MLKICKMCYFWDLRDIVKQIGICGISKEMTAGETLCLHDKQEEDDGHMHD